MLRTTQRENNDVEDLKSRAEQGDSEAQYQLGSVYYEGKDIVKDDGEAAKWFLEAAIQNHAFAQCILASYYETGVGVTHNLEKAFYWYTKASESNVPYAQFRLGMFYRDGHVIGRDHRQAFVLFEKAAEQGISEAQYELALAYLYARGVEKDLTKAFDWVKKAAHVDLAIAQSLLGCFYLEGVGTHKNTDEGLTWMRKGAEGGDVYAMHNLSRIYSNGAGVAKNEQLGFDYGKKAADKNLAVAQYHLAHTYRPFTGLNSDMTQYHYWLRRAWYGEDDILHVNGSTKQTDLKSTILSELQQDFFKASEYHYYVLKQDVTALRSNPALLVKYFHTFDATKIKEDPELLSFFKAMTFVILHSRVDFKEAETLEGVQKISYYLENHWLIHRVNQVNELRSPTHAAYQELINTIISSIQEPHAEHLSIDHLEKIFTTLYLHWTYGLLGTELFNEEIADNLSNLASLLVTITQPKISGLSNEVRLMLASMLVTTLSVNTRSLSLSIRDQLTPDNLTRLCEVFNGETWKDGRFRSSPDSSKTLVTSFDDFIHPRMVGTLSTIAYRQGSGGSLNEEEEQTNKVRGNHNNKL